MLHKQLETIRKMTDFVPEIAIVLGSGLGGLIKNVDVVAEIPYDSIEGFPVSTAPAHKGCFVFGILEGKRVAVMNGRVHLYEGYSPKEVVMPIRLLRALGCDKLILTNASGGISKGLNAGDLMMISDHISCFIKSPLIGKNDDALGTRFPDMSKVYDKELQSILSETASELNIELKRGVYVQLTGPQFETPAEIKMLGILGADAVGMSTVIEAIAANHCGFRICAISLIANLACGLLDKPLTHDEISQAGNDKAEEFGLLLRKAVGKL